MIWLITQRKTSLCPLIRDLLGILLLMICAANTVSASGFRVPPYLQNPTKDGMTLIWFSNQKIPGTVTCTKEQSKILIARHTSSPTYASNLQHFPEQIGVATEKDSLPAPPYRHRVRIEGLSPSTTYRYSVQQGKTFFESEFTTAPTVSERIRFIVYADSETEPESTGTAGNWPDSQGNQRTYLLDQTSGYAQNLAVIAARQPDFVAIAGDLVESGGEQQDWDEFWRHNTSLDGAQSLASRIPFFATPGNHEYYEGPRLGQYTQPGSERAIERYLSYFEFPPNGASNPTHQGRYHSINYGPVTLIALDVSNNSPHQTENDTNFFLLGEDDKHGGNAPAFNVGSEQYNWLRNELARAQHNSVFTFVYFHHVPYSVGPHGWPPGECLQHTEGPHSHYDTQSGQPLRALTPLFSRYGVDAVFAGHDEMFERSELHGLENRANSLPRKHIVHFYDVGVGGDGLRGPQPGLVNPHQAFLAHSSSPEIWRNGILIDGGKHYGHLEVDVQPLPNGHWQAILKPIYVFPIFDKSGNHIRSERRVYNDVITLTEPKNNRDNETNSH